MSRSNPTDNQPNPSTRWFEWDGQHGGIRYYDKEKKEQVSVKLPFTFILLDQLATVKGWNEPSQSGIYSNEIRDTRQEALVVKAFKGGVIATGIYASIKDRVAAAGGHFTANIYIGYKVGNNPLAIGSLQFKGAALNAWVEFSKKNRKALYEQAVVITGSTSGKKGSVVFQTPTFQLKAVAEDTNAAALALDKELQEYLRGYFQRTKTAAAVPQGEAEPPAEDNPPADESPMPDDVPPGIDPESGEAVQDDVPF